MRDYLIINNPFHILSISASASKIEVENAFNNMMSCIDKGQSISGCRFDICDFGELDRSADNLIECKEKLLKLAELHRMYWFDKSEYTKTWNDPLYTNDFLEAISSGTTPSNYDDFLALVLFWTSFYGNPFLWERIGLALFKYVYDMRNNNMSNIILSTREGRDVTHADDSRKQLLKVLIYTTSDNQDNAYVRKLCGELYSTEWFQDELGLSPSKAKKYAIIEYCQAMIYEKDNPDFFTAGNVLELEEKLPSIIWKALAFRFLEFKLSSWTYVYDELFVKHDIGYDMDRQIVEKVEARVGKPKKQYLVDEYRKAVDSGEINERVEGFENYIKLTTGDDTLDFDSIFQDKYDVTDVDSGWVDNRSPKEKYKEACELLNNGHKERALEILLNLKKEKNNDYVLCKLGDIYSKIDSYQAQIWYLGAALSGNAKAMQLLAMSYETDGYYKEAAEFYLKGAEHNKGFCKKCLLRMCIQGRWKPENPGIFLSWYETDAKKGKVVAQRSMGDIYWYGFGVESNKNTALDWYM
ncbi:MAG: sel1 repeat family protein, partial [Lachnospiraceae bacterium]|nr:sel1 repeat family protein [Lachnospiraceae bacterium]